MQPSPIRRAVLSAALLSALVPPPAAAQTPAEAYALGCAPCHRSEARVLRAIPPGTQPARRAWLTAFVDRHPCERESLKPLIIEYLLERTRPR